MKTNLIFKRSIVEDGITKVQTKILPVDISGIESGEGWILSGHADEIIYNQPEVKKPVKKVEKIRSDVTGTAKLVRSRGVIKIAARRGKYTYDQSTPTSICISDYVKNEFFNNCRAAFGSCTSKFWFTEDDTKFYDYWSKFIDDEFARQKIAYENKKRGA